MSNDWKERLARGVQKVETSAEAAAQREAQLRQEYPTHVKNTFDMVEEIANSINEIADKKVVFVNRNGTKITVAIKDTSFSIEDMGFAMRLGAWGGLRISTQPPVRFPFNEVYLRNKEGTNQPVWAYKQSNHQRAGRVMFGEFGKDSIDTLYQEVFRSYLG